MTDHQQYTVEQHAGWSYIIGPNSYREGPIRYAWEAQEWADEMNTGKEPPRRSDGENVEPK